MIFFIRRKAEEERLRKEEEKTRRELIKQEYLRRKQQEMFEEQGLVKPKTPKPKQKHRPKSVFREESSSDNFSKGSSTRENEPLFSDIMFILSCIYNYKAFSRSFKLDNVSSTKHSSVLSVSHSRQPEQRPVRLQPVTGLCCNQ